MPHFPHNIKSTANCIGSVASVFMLSLKTLSADFSASLVLFVSFNICVNVSAAFCTDSTHLINVPHKIASAMGAAFHNHFKTFDSVHATHDHVTA